MRRLVERVREQEREKSIRGEGERAREEKKSIRGCVQEKTAIRLCTNNHPETNYSFVLTFFVVGLYLLLNILERRQNGTHFDIVVVHAGPLRLLFQVEILENKIKRENIQ